VYGTAAKTHIDKLNAALKVSLRTILGAKKSTPIEIIYSELGIEPIQLRREWLTATYTLRLGRKSSNAAYASARLTTRNTAALTAALTRSDTLLVCLLLSSKRVKSTQEPSHNLRAQNRFTHGTHHHLHGNHHSSEFT